MDHKCYLLQEDSIIEMIRKYNEKEFLAKEWNLYANLGRIMFNTRPLGKSFLGMQATHLVLHYLLPFNETPVLTKYILLSETLTL